MAAAVMKMKRRTKSSGGTAEGRKPRQPSAPPERRILPAENPSCRAAAVEPHHSSIRSRSGSTPLPCSSLQLLAHEFCQSAFAAVKDTVRYEFCMLTYKDNTSAVSFKFLKDRISVKFSCASLVWKKAADAFIKESIAQHDRTIRICDPKGIAWFARDRAQQTGSSICSSCSLVPAAGAFVRQPCLQRWATGKRTRSCAEKYSALETDAMLRHESS